jgi:hypothetical protein
LRWHLMLRLLVTDTGFIMAGTGDMDRPSFSGLKLPGSRFDTKKADQMQRATFELIE